MHTTFDSDDEGQSTASKSVERAPKSKSFSTTEPTNIHTKAVTTVRGRGRKRSTALQKPVGAQIRTLERLLKNKSRALPPAVRKQKEEQLTQLRRLAGEKTRRQTEGSIAKKYHMVRFFERRKLERILHALQQKGDTGPDDQEKKAQVVKDLVYVRNFPKGRKYVALFPKGGHTDESRAEVAAIRAQIDNFLNASSLVDADAGNKPSKSRPTDGNTHPDDDNGTDNSVEEMDDFFLEDAVE